MLLGSEVLELLYNESFFATCERDALGRCMSAEGVAMRDTPPKKIEKLGGGINETSKVTLKDGTVGVWKPSTGETTDVPRNVKAGTYYRRETAASDIADALGLGDLVPTTVTREIDGKVGSFQKFGKGAIARKLDDKAKWFPDEKDLARGAVYDLLIGQIDRHAGNWLVDGKKITLIDNGGAFPIKDDKNFRSRLTQEASKRGLKVLKEVASWDATRIDKVLASHGIEASARKLVTKRLEMLKKRVGKTIPESPDA